MLARHSQMVESMEELTQMVIHESDMNVQAERDGDDNEILTINR